MTQTPKHRHITFRYTLLSTVLALAIMGAGIFAIARPNAATPTASAATCDKVNIIYCGLGGSSAGGYIASFKSYYNRGSDGRYNDLRAVYRWAGATSGAVSGMNTNNTKVGTLYRNGDIKVDGKVVGRNSWFAARFGAGRDGFVHITGNVYARKTTTSLAHDTYRVIVHFNQNGQADFAVAVTCGNAIRFTPTPPPPKPSLQCDKLTFAIINRANRTYEFTARATAKNMKITSYLFKFGDGKQATVKTNKSTATTRHQYPAGDKEYTAQVYVSSSHKSGVTSPACQVKIKIETKRSLVCTSLAASLANQEDATNYTFTATAQPTNTTITKYVFDFGDGDSQTVTTNNTTATTNHTYSQADTEFTAKVSVSSTDFSNITAPACEVTIKTPKQPESPALVCENLKLSIVAGQKNTYKFVATASASNTGITGYVFDFGDGSTRTVTASDTSATTEHTYGSSTQDYTATVAVNSEDIKGVTSAACKVSITGKTPPVLGVSTELPNTGSGDVAGFFAATTAAGALIHRFVIRRKLA